MFDLKKPFCQGLTLIEIIVALGLSLLTLSAIYTLYIRELKAQHIREEVLEMQQQARVAMDVMARDTLMAGYDPVGVNRDEHSDNDFHGVTYDPQKLILQADLNGNGILGDANEGIVYLYDASTHTLRRNTGGGNQPFGENMQGFTVKFLDQHGHITNDSKVIRTVEIQVTARTQHADPSHEQNGGYRTLTLHSRVTPRNL